MAQANIIQVFGQNRARLAFLQNAYEISYNKVLNSLWTASFSMPSDDPKTRYCQPFNYVELYDGKERVELFRIIGEDFTKSTQAVTVYDCEHVLSTLIDDVMFQYHQIGNIGVYTKEVLQYILNRQTSANWRLGICDFTRQFEYKWENENLLSALLSVANPFTESYKWEWDTEDYPWTIHLRKISPEVKSEIRYGKNMSQIAKTTDATNVVTRLYCLGYGEGDNQLDIRAVNGGVPYIDAPTKTKWGLKSSILVDKRFESAEFLLEYGRQILNAACEPYVSYEVEAIDLYKLTGQRYDQFVIGDMVKIVDSADSINAAFPIVEIAKSDITGNPGGITITIANKSKDLSGSISDLQNRALIADLYAQGATNQVMVNFTDNADKDNPALLKLFVPDSMVRVNTCVLNFEFESFRAYEKGIASTQQTVYSTSSTNYTYTSTSYDWGGIQTSSSEPTKVESTSVEASKQSSTDGGGYSSQTSSSAVLDARYMISEDNNTMSSAVHNHGLYPGTNLITSVSLSGDAESGYNLNYTSVGWVPSGAHSHGSHDHTFSTPNHNHTFTIPSHNHSVTIPSHNHTVNIPGHSHTIDIPGHNHSVTIPAHTHDMQYGIFKGNMVESGRLFVNGVFKMNVAPNTDYNLAPLLAGKDGKIARETFHRIEVYPTATDINAQAQTRIVANIFMQIFTNSRGGGDY